MCKFYHLPLAGISLFVPRTYHQMHGGDSSIHSKKVEIHLGGHKVIVPIDMKISNIPIFFTQM